MGGRCSQSAGDRHLRPHVLDGGERAGQPRGQVLGQLAHPWPPWAMPSLPGTAPGGPDALAGCAPFGRQRSPRGQPPAPTLHKGQFAGEPAAVSTSLPERPEKKSGHPAKAFTRRTDIQCNKLLSTTGNLGHAVGRPPLDRGDPCPLPSRNRAACFKRHPGLSAHAGRGQESKRGMSSTNCPKCPV